MVHTVVFEDEIVLYWDKEWEYPDGVRYRILLNGRDVWVTDKTHFRLTGLQPQTLYSVIVERLSQNNVPFAVLLSSEIYTKTQRKRIDVTQAPYFAVGDGKTLNTKALQRAIDDCKAGETVYIPQGTYMTGALDLHSGMELFLDKNSVLQGTVNVADYLPKRLGRFEGIELECYRALLNIGKLDHKAGYNCEDIIIRGGGTIFGGGSTLAFAIIDAETEAFQDSLTENEHYLEISERPQPIPVRASRTRSRLISIENCENVIIGNMTLGYSAAWNVHMVYSKDVVTYGCKILSKGVWNGDGWDPDSSENCVLFDTVFSTQDDAVAIKSGKNPQGNIIARPTKNVRIFDCKGTHGIAIGSELSGGVANVFVWDCEFLRSVNGVTVKTTRKRGGYVKNLRVRNCKLPILRIMSCYTCNDDGETSGKLTDLEDFYYENVTLTGVPYSQGTGEPMNFPPIFLWGMEEEDKHIRNVTLKNVRVCARENGEVQNIAVKFVKNLNIEGLECII